MTTEIFFNWAPLPEEPADNVQYMGNMVAHYRAPTQPDPGFVSRARAMVVLMDDQEGQRRLQIVILVDEYKVDGISRQPVRNIFDRWAVALAEGVTF